MKNIMPKIVVASVALTTLTACVPGGTLNIGYKVGSNTGALSINLANVNEIIAVPTHTNDVTPSYTFETPFAGSIVYGGACSSSTASANVGFNSIEFNTLTDGTYSNCTIKVVDGSKESNVLSVSSFIIDTVNPVIAEVKAIQATNSTTPEYTFSSDEVGSIVAAGGCSLGSNSATSGNNVVNFQTLNFGSYENCTITVQDLAGNYSNQLMVSDFYVVRLKALNDTGITTCGDYAFTPNSTNHNNDIDCSFAGGVDDDSDPLPNGQDAQSGRDVTHNDSTDGLNGFSFHKLGVNGTELSIQNAAWSDSGLEDQGTKWTCIKDNITGLVWEMKTNDNGLHDRDHRYSWYNSTNVNDGGERGVGDTGTLTTTGYEAGSTVYAGTDTCSNAAECDTEKYIAAVNAANYCGRSSWRLPNSEELLSIVVKSQTPTIDVNYFVSMTAINVWTATTKSSEINKAWRVNFQNGEEGYAYKHIVSGSVMLVSDN